MTAAEWMQAYRANALYDPHPDEPGLGHRLLAHEAHAAAELVAERTAWRMVDLAVTDRVSLDSQR